MATPALPALHASHAGCLLRDGSSTTRALAKGEPIEIRLRPARGEEKAAALEHVEKQVEGHDASLHHDDSLTVESLRAALDAAR